MKTIFKMGDVDTIVNSAIQDLQDCTFVVYCTDYEHFDEISNKFHKNLKNAKKIGTTGYMITQNGGVSAGMVATGFTDDEVEVHVGTLRKIDTCPIKYVPGLIWTAEEISKQYKDNLCLAFSTGHEERVVSTMKVSLERVGMRLVGATAGNVPEGQPKKVSCNGKIMSDCTVYATIGSKMGKIKIHKQNLFRERENVHVVTKVSEDRRTVLEIDHRKALDVYEEEVGRVHSKNDEKSFTNTLNRVVGAENYITAIFSYNTDERSITTYKNLQRNDLISVTDIEENYRQFITDDMNELCAGSNVAGIISINCILRYLFFEKEGYTKAFAKELEQLSGGNHLGIVSDGEQYMEQHVNQSMVNVVFTRDK